jgi:small subunit ribosomal protein S7
MSRGNKNLAHKIFYGALGVLWAFGPTALETLKKAVDNVKPQQEVRSRRVGGATYQVPVPVKRDRAEALAVRWIITAARGRKGLPMVKALAAELKAASQEQGEAFKKKENIHRMAEANKAFAHFRW